MMADRVLSGPAATLAPDPFRRTAALSDDFPFNAILSVTALR